MKFQLELLGEYRAQFVEDSGRLWVTRGYDVYYSDDLGASFSFRARLDRRWFTILSTKWTLTTRFLRQGFIHLYPLQDGSLLGVIRGGIVRCDPNNDRFNLVLDCPGKTMKIEIMPDGTIFAGEYFYNKWRESVAILHSDDAGTTWKNAYRFNPGEIRHVHSLYFDKRLNSLLVLTGDIDKECKVLFTDDHFKSIRVLTSGNQRSRAYLIIPAVGGYYFPTDTQFEQNYIQFLSFDGLLSIRCPIVGSCLAGCKVGAWSVFATAAEPSPVNYDPSISLYATCNDKEWHVIHRWHVDRWSWPSGLQAAVFGMGRVFLPAGENHTGYLFGTPVAARKNNDILHRWELKE